MADENETLEPTASEEQPVPDQAVESPVVEDQQAPSEDTREPSGAPTETPAPRVYAGKYKTPDELEEAYRNANAENSRMAAELAAARRQPAQPKTEKPTYTTDQLETWKEGRIREVARYESLAAKHMMDGNHAEAERYNAAAQESARQVRLIDSELRKLDIQQVTQSQTRRTAESRLVGEAVNIVQQYKGDLVPGNPLYDKASEYMAGYEAMGMDVESPLVQAQAVSMAAQVLGLSSKKVEQTTRKELTKSIGQALKQGVVTGAGKAAKSASAAPNFDKMTDAEFIAYKRQRGWD